MYINTKKISMLSLRVLLGAVALSASAVWVNSFAGSAIAQEIDRETDRETAEEQPTLADKYEDVFFTFDQTFYQNRRFPRNAFWIFGSFPENEIAGDGRVINRLYTETLRQQVTSDPTIRTADLPTPFSSSLQSDPIYTAEPVPAAPFAPTFRQTEAPVPVNSEAIQQAPVPALW